jgi:hypothetical protein
MSHCSAEGLGKLEIVGCACWKFHRRGVETMRGTCTLWLLKATSGSVGISRAAMTGGRQLRHYGRVITISSIPERNARKYFTELERDRSNQRPNTPRFGHDERNARIL